MVHGLALLDAQIVYSRLQNDGSVSDKYNLIQNVFNIADQMCGDQD